MEKRRLTLSLLMAVLSTAAFAQFTTAGDGKTYTLKTLSETEGSGVTLMDGNTYIMGSDVTISEGDKFTMDDGVTVQFDKDVTLTIEGEADFLLTEGSVFDSAFDSIETLGAAIRIKSKTPTEVQHCTFSYVGLELMAEGATNVRHCQFYHHDGSSAAALYFITAGAESTIEDCLFEACRKAAIGSAANASQPLTIKGCTLIRNSTANNNVPQINITAADPLVISECTIEGIPENNMVGGIGISNFMSYNADILISNCTVEDNRYGIGLVGPAPHIRIEDCTLLNNCHETNPMNGGSGISLYDPYQLTQAVISGNHIEGSLWGVTIIGCKDVNLGQPSNADIDSPGGNVFKNNGNNGQLYDLYNNSALTVYAQNNTWNVTEQTQEQIETVIFHQADNASLGEVIYWPAASDTAIETIDHSPSAIDHYYGLDGISRKTLQKGINIVHGKKVVY